MKLAKDAIFLALTPENVLDQLMGDVSRYYPDIAELEIAYVILNFQAVQAGGGWMKLLKRVQDGELPHCAAILVQILQQLKVAP